MASRPRSRLALRLSAAVALAIVGAMLAVNWVTGSVDPAQQQALLVVFLGVAVMGGLLFAGLLDLLVTRPLERVVGEVRRAAGSGWDRPIAVPSGAAELEELAQALEQLRGSVVAQRAELEALNAQLEGRVRDRTAQLESAQAQLVAAARLAGLGELAAGVAHEVNNPTGVILTRVGYLLSIADEEGLDTDVIEDLSTIEHQARRVARITQSLLQFGRPTGASRAPVLVDEVLELTSSLLAHRAKQKKITLEVKKDPGATVVANRDQLEQVVFNLLQNAIDACGEGGRVVVRSLPDGLEVEDDGAGMSPEVKAKIFEPFFSTKPVGEGTGLGLSVSYGILTEHGGRLEVESVEGEGSRFRVRLPGGAG